jgi:hypothetical protein
MGEAFTRHSLRPLDFLEGHAASHSSGVIRRGNADVYLLFENVKLHDPQRARRAGTN